MRTITDLIDSQAEPPRTETLEEMNRRMYLEDVARLSDFTPEPQRTLWPTPIGPKWKN